MHQHRGHGRKILHPQRAHLLQGDALSCGRLGAPLPRRREDLPWRWCLPPSRIRPRMSGLVEVVLGVKENSGCTFSGREG